MSVFCGCRFLCCCYLTDALATTSTGAQSMAMQIQIWRKWTTTWKEKLYVHHMTLFTSDLCIMIDFLIMVLCGVFFCSKESLCGQRGLLPNTDIQTFQVSLTNHLRSHYERIREPLSRVCVHVSVCCCYFLLLLLLFGWLCCAPEEWTVTADGHVSGQPFRAEHQSVPHHEPLPWVHHWPRMFKFTDIDF